MVRCVIIGAVEISNYSRIKSYLRPDDFYICCDAGLDHAENLGIKPNLIIGDFDSHEKPQTKIETIQLPCEKDDTDSFYACKEAIRRGFNDFLLLGVIGQRFDHSLVNISLLLYLQKEGKKALLIDDYSEMQLVGTDPVQIPDSFSYFSLLCVAGDVSGVTIKNAKYPIENAAIQTSYQYACSNEVLPGKTALVNLEKGILLLIKIY